MPEASSHSDPAWLYTRPAFGRHGRTLSENNFQKERKDWLAVLCREVLQNGLDARPETSSKPVEVRFARVEVKGVVMETFLPDAHLERLKVSLPHSNQTIERPTQCLVIEDFGTTGLTGTMDDPEVDGRGENWNAFWFREGEGGKEKSSGNGGAGQGKITYFSASSVRTILAYTVRSDDAEQAIYGASSFLRDYEFLGHKQLRDSYWGMQALRDDEQSIVVPPKDLAAVESFKSAFGLTRRHDEPGLSLIIPGAKPFKDEEALRVVLAEFFAPIYRGDLVVRIGSVVVDKTSVVSLADEMLSDVDARDLRTCMTQGFRAFYIEALEASSCDALVMAPAMRVPSDLSERSFDSDALKTMREGFDKGERIGVRFVVKVKPRDDNMCECSFDVHLQQPDNLDQPEQAVLRRDLLIGEEPIGGGRLRQRVRAVTIVPNSPLSRLLLCAEEPTHLRWNTRLPRLGEYFRDGPEAVAFVRNAGAKLVDLLSGGEQRRDFRLLAKYFAAPGTSASTAAKGKKSPKGKNMPDKPVLPPVPPALVSLSPLKDGCRIAPTGHMYETPAAFPLAVLVEFAYEGLDRDAFAEYDPLDFDLQDEQFTVIGSGCDNVERSGNRLRFNVRESEFEMVVRGFDPYLRLRMRLNYTEARDAADVET